MEAYPDDRAARRAFITATRPVVDRTFDLGIPAGTTIDEEPDAPGRPVRVGTIFLTGAECPWRCAMCDLWQHTITGPTPPGAIPAQIRAAVQSLAPIATGVRHIKLYNAGSFFDARAIPESDDDAIAHLVASFDRVIVESHPALLGRRLVAFKERLRRAAERRDGSSDARGPALEVAVGVETAHPEALERLDKHVTLDDLRRAGDVLAEVGAALRAFLLINPPFVPHDEQDHWLVESVRFAEACGARVVSLIPTRSGNGTMEVLERRGLFRRPSLADVERAFAACLALDARPFVLVDLWDLDRVAACGRCAAARRERLRQMNLAQRVLPVVHCPDCGTGRAA